jgi:hypothetical protein
MMSTQLRQIAKLGEGDLWKPGAGKLHAGFYAGG